MANYYFLHCRLLVLLLLLTIPSLTISSPSSPPPPPLSDLQQQQLIEVISSLISSGEFRIWAGLLSSSSSSALYLLPLNATLFIPSDAALSHLPTAFDPLIIPYHILPQRLTFSHLRLFPTNSCLPTLLPSNSILITNNSLFNFTINNSPITRPDFYLTPAVAVHGIETILEYSIFGGNNSSSTIAPETPTPTPIPTTTGEIAFGWESDGGAYSPSWSEFPIFVLTFLVVLSRFMEFSSLLFWIELMR